MGFKIRNTLLYQNESTSSGGGLYITGDETLLASCKIYNNSATLYGGGIYASGDRIDVQGCEIYQNTASSGAGLYIHSTVGFKLSNTLLYQNESISSGGGLHFSQVSDASLINTTVYNNRASDGNEIYSTGTIGAVTMTNSIVWNDAGDTNLIAGSDVNASYSIIRDALGYVNNGNVSSEDPQLTSQALLTAASTRAIDQGLDLTASIDIHEELRPSGAGFDIGADEFVDSDGDRLPDWLEALGVTEPSGDEDGDGLENLYEYENDLDLFNPDMDEDGLADGQEVLITGTNPLVYDTDELDTDLNLDGLDDSIGIQLGIAVDQLDSDGDGLSNDDERLRGTNPHEVDSDGDGEDDFIDPFPLNASFDSSDFINSANDVTAPKFLLTKPVEAIEI